MPALVDIQKLQFSDRKEAERQLLALLRGSYRDDIHKVELNPKPESLNSLNGFVTLKDGHRYFFKTHTEENEKVHSYYNAQLLADSGYPVVLAQEINSAPGQQIAMYEVINFPTLFDLIKGEEDAVIAGKGLSERAKELIELQKELDRKVAAAYKSTLQSGEDETSAPVHQLFYHRLCEGGRVDIFYKDASVSVQNEDVPFQELKNMRWTINGVEYDASIWQLVEQAKERLRPRNKVLTVVGHGDAHNGNVFWDEPGNQLLYFDPAFAGRHDPVLDMAKPIFHNVFARWMYFPVEVAAEIALEARIEDGMVLVRHNFCPSAIRQEFLKSKLQYTLRPSLGRFSQSGLDSQWMLRLRSALFACAFLTVNLMAENKHDGSLAHRYPNSIRMLALSIAIEMAAEPVGGENQISAMVAEITSVAKCTTKMMQQMESDH